MSVPHTVINLSPRFSDCCVCNAPLVDCRKGVPVYEGDVVPNDWAGEWLGMDACDVCYQTQGLITEPKSMDELLALAGVKRWP